MPGSFGFFRQHSSSQQVIEKRPLEGAAAPPRDWKWSPAEKRFAAERSTWPLSRELASVSWEAKERGQWIREASNLWETEDWLAARRPHIDRSFDFRYSVLPIVFATLLCHRRLNWLYGHVKREWTRRDE
jgi:hypothetical protein